MEPTIPAGRKRPRANQRDCLIGPNRTARKAFAMWLTNPPLRMFHTDAVDPIAQKRINRELRARGL